MDLLRVEVSYLDLVLFIRDTWPAESEKSNSECTLKLQVIIKSVTSGSLLFRNSGSNKVTRGAHFNALWVKSNKKYSFKYF